MNEKIEAIRSWLESQLERQVEAWVDYGRGVYFHIAKKGTVPRTRLFVTEEFLEDTETGDALLFLEEEGIHRILSRGEAYYVSNDYCRTLEDNE